MYVYLRERDKTIFCSPDGDGNIAGCKCLGYDKAIGKEFAQYVIGFERTAVFDNERIKKDEEAAINYAKMVKIDELMPKFLRCLILGNSDGANEYIMSAKKIMEGQ